MESCNNKINDLEKKIDKISDNMLTQSNVTVIYNKFSYKMYLFLFIIIFLALIYLNPKFCKKKVNNKLKICYKKTLISTIIIFILILCLFNYLF